MTFEKDAAEFSSLTKKIKQIDGKIHNLDKKKLVEKKYSHATLIPMTWTRRLSNYWLRNVICLNVKIKWRK